MTFMPPVFREPRRRWRRVDPVVRLVVGNWALGMVLGALLATGMLLFDALGLRTLLWRSDVALAGTILFIGSFALTFGGVVAASAVMRAGQDDDDEPRGGLRAPTLAYAAAARRAR
jgi:hypothetical protein